MLLLNVVTSEWYCMGFYRSVGSLPDKYYFLFCLYNYRVCNDFQQELQYFIRWLDKCWTILWTLRHSFTKSMRKVENLKCECMLKIGKNSDPEWSWISGALSIIKYLNWSDWDYVLWLQIHHQPTLTNFYFILIRACA